ncbi:MAG TPA: hypothetical protein VK806_07460 [Bacteroidia bacterium]|jgi:hypothetical protein|nr:hypothetical protein [Bacteroidia bacterium]
MDVQDAVEILLKTIHDDLHGRIVWSKFLDEKSDGYGERGASEIRGSYSRALIILIDEKLCNKVPNSDIIEIAQKGIDAKGDYIRYLKKKKTTLTLEKLRRIAPIASFIIVLISFIITMLKKNSANHAAYKPPTTIKAKDTKSTGKK